MVVMPECRRKMLYGKMRRPTGAIGPELEELVVDPNRLEDVFESDPVVMGVDVTSARPGAKRMNGGVPVTGSAC